MSLDVVHDINALNCTQAKALVAWFYLTGANTCIPIARTGAYGRQQSAGVEVAWRIRPCNAVPSRVTMPV